MRILLTLAFIFALPSLALAQDMNTILDIPEGRTLLNVSATESVEVEQDLLIATLKYEDEDADPSVLQKRINAIMRKAIDSVSKVKSAKAVTQGYSVFQYDRSRDRTRRDIVWKGQQGLVIKSKDSGTLLNLTGELQSMGLTMNGLGYTVSPELLEATHGALLEAALTKLQAKAQSTAKAIGKSSVELLQVNVDNNGYVPQTQMYSMDAGLVGMAKMEIGEPPVAPPGESLISLSISAQALLK